jgi:FlaA1/EpsC-like NDP-sugar epimerase
VARALIGDRDVEITITGIRPGEKMHEILVSEEEAHHCIARGAYYAIRPMLPELCNGAACEPNALTKEYSSGDDVLSLQDTVALLKKHKLMLEDVHLAQGDELLR